MADFTQIIQEINDDINTNGVGAITGAKLNEVLRDMIAAVNAEKQDPLTIDAAPTEDSTNPVQSGGVFTALANLIAEDSLFGGFVGPDTQPWHGNDHRYFYIAFNPGTYVNFNNWEISEPSMFFWNQSFWGYTQLWLSEQTINDMAALKANIVNGATAGNFAGLDADGNLTDSGIAATDVATTSDLAGKQDTISDLDTIRSGADAGSTAVQPSDLATVATSGDYDDLLNKPTIPAAQVQSDWDEADNTKVDYIKNKPTIPDVSGKADKVNGATNGDFAGLDGNGNLVDTGYNEDDFSLKVVFFDVSTTPSSMLPNKVYRFGTLSGNTTFPAFAAVPSGDTEVKIWCWTFTTPSTAPTITWPAGITSWAGGSAPTINASKSYEVSVMDGFATIIEN